MSGSPGAAVLRPEHRAELERSGISPELILEAAVRSVAHDEAYDFGFRNGSGRTDGLVFPFTDLEALAPSRRFAILKPDLRANGAKYLSPVGERPRLYLTPGVTAETLKDATIPVLAVEGVKKTLAVETWRRLAGRLAVVVGINGCWGWLRSIKGLLPDGRLGKIGSEPIADFDMIEWKGRLVIVCLDGDVMTNKSVGQAERALVKELMRRGATVRAVRIPPALDGSRRGADDFIVQEGDEAWSRLLDEAVEVGRPKIKITLDVRGVADQALDALIAVNAGIYQRTQSLVKVIHESGRPSKGIIRAEGAPIIAAIGDSGLLELLTDASDWIAIKRRGDTLAETPTLPPEHIRKVLLARGTWPGLPWLEGIINSPTIRADGTILVAPGHDPESGLLLDLQGVIFPPIKDRPTREDAREAKLDLAAPFAEFPFTDQDAGLSACVAAVLTLIGRHAFDGPAPMFAIRSTTPGSGKDLMACAICIIATGREPARTTAPRGKEGDAEWRKRILAHALAADAAILIGNVEGALGAPTLADTLTKTSITERMLGVSRNLTVPIFAVWFCTGNGISFRGDLGRRVVLVELAPDVEHPEDRSGPEAGKKWTYADLLAYVRKERPRLVSAALTLLRAFHVAGRPGHGLAPKGSFDGWDAMVRAAVIWAGFADPLGGCEVIRQEGDADLDALRGALACWRDTFKEPVTASHAVTTARRRARHETDTEGNVTRDGDAELLNALSALAGREAAKLDGQMLGTALHRVKGRIADGLRFVINGRDRRRKQSKWTVEGKAEA